ncbi:MAG: ABC transporter substrate-binding protein [Dehalococcoidia bacterium]
MAEGLSRRRFLVGIGSAAAAAAFIAACSEDGDQPSGGATTTGTSTGTPRASSTPAPTETASPEFPKTVQTFLGPVTIEAQPERVYVVDSWSFDFVTALGITPVGAAVYSAPSGWMAGPEVAATPVELITEGVPIEAIAAMAPDLITDSSGFFSQGDTASFELLQGIAPVVSPPGEWLSSPWRDRFRTIGEALGLSGLVEEQIASADAALAAARDQYAALAGAPATFARFNAASSTFDVIIGAEDFTRQFLNEELGFATPEQQVQALESGAVEAVGGAASGVSFERLDLVLEGAELAVVFVAGPTEALTGEPLWQQHPMVAEGRVVLVDFDTLLAIRTPSPRAVNHVITTLLPALADAHAGA